MQYPDFFDKVEKITLKDPLSDFLGTFKDGIIEFSYLEIVKMAGHSCPTVAGAYLISLKALKELYKDQIPVRGDIKVLFKEKEDTGVTGVIANVISNITGATKTSGFKGIAGNFVRHSLMDFGQDIPSMVRFIRKDTNEAVDIFYDSSKIPANPKMKELMQKVLSNQASKQEIDEFHTLWQGRVEKLLLELKDNQEVIKIIKV